MTAVRIAGLMRQLDRFTDAAGRLFAWLGLATVLLCFATVYLRYVFDMGLIWLQESYIWTHAAAVMLGSAYSLHHGGFVRVDIFYARMGARGRAWIDLLGSLVLLAPFLLMLAYSGWSFFSASLRMNERSMYEGGLPATYILKATLLMFVALLAVQGLAMVLRAILALVQGAPQPGAAAAPSAPAADTPA